MTKRIPAAIQKIMDDKEDEWNQYEVDVEPVRAAAMKKGEADAKAGKRKSRAVPKKYREFSFAYGTAYFEGYSMVMCSSEAPEIKSF